MKTSTQNTPSQTKALQLAERGGEIWKHGNDAEAFAVLTEARQLAEETDNPFALAAALYHLGELAYIRAAFMQTGDLQQAMEYHQQALTIREELNNLQGVALSLSRIGTLHERAQNFDQAVACFERAITISAEIDFPTGKIRPYTHLAAHHHRNGDSQTALELDQQSLAISEEIGDQESIVFGLMNLAGATYRINGDVEAVLAHYQRALQLAEKLDFKLAIGRIYFDLAGYYKREGDVDQALDYLQKLSHMMHAIQYKTLAELADRQIAELKNPTN